MQVILKMNEMLEMQICDELFPAVDQTLSRAVIAIQSRSTLSSPPAR